MKKKSRRVGKITPKKIRNIPFSTAIAVDPCKFLVNLRQNEGNTRNFGFKSEEKNERMELNF